MAVYQNSRELELRKVQQSERNCINIILGSKWCITYINVSQYFILIYIQPKGGTFKENKEAKG